VLLDRERLAITTAFSRAALTNASGLRIIAAKAKRIAFR
jgi:hypothetical protein